jgi:hypothetical protein
MQDKEGETGKIRSCWCALLGIMEKNSPDYYDYIAKRDKKLSKRVTNLLIRLFRAIKIR